MKINEDKLHRTNVVSSSDLDRFEGTVKLIRQAWDNLPDDIEVHEREMFVEIASKVLALQNNLREQDKEKESLN